MAAFQPGKPVHRWQLRFEGDWVTSVAFLGSGNRVAAGNRLGRVFVWDLPVDEPVDGPGSETPRDAAPTLRLDGHSNAITRMVAMPDGKTLFSASMDHTVGVWDLTAKPTGEAEVVMDTDARQIKAKRARKEDKQGILDAPGTKVPTQQAAHVMKGHSDWVQAMGLSRDGKRLITGDDAGRVVVWDVATRKPVTQWDGHPGGWIVSGALTGKGEQAFVGEYCHRRGDFDRPPAQARIYDAGSGKLQVDLLEVQFPKVKKRDNSYGYATTWGKFVKQGFVAADFSPDGSLLAVAQGGETDTGRVHLLEVKTGKLIRTVSGHRYGATDVVFSADGTHVLSTGRDTSVRICRVNDGKEVAVLGKPRGGQYKDWFHAVALSPDGRHVAAADMAGMVHVWSLGNS